MSNVKKIRLVVKNVKGVTLEEPNLWNDEKIEHHLNFGDSIDCKVWCEDEITTTSYAYIKIPNTNKIIAETMGDLAKNFCILCAPLDSGEKEC